MFEGGGERRGEVTICNESELLATTKGPQTMLCFVAYPRLESSAIILTCRLHGASLRL